MSNISFGNLTYNEQRRIQNNSQAQQQQPQFGALDKAKLEADAVEIANKTKEKTKEQTKENFIFRTLRNTFGVEDPKKTLISIACTIGTVVGLAALGNKSSNSMAQLGQKVDDVLVNNKAYNSAANFFSGIKKSVGNTLGKSKTVQDIQETMQNRKAKPVRDLFRGMGRGFVSIFSLTPVDILEKGLKANGIDTVDKATKSLRKLVGDTPEAQKLAKELAENLVGSGEKMDNKLFCQKLSKAMAENLGCATSDKKFLNALIEDLQKGTFNGKDVSEFVDVNMKGGGPIGSWWPVNIINSIGQKLGFKKQIGRGNLGDSLVKFNAVNGSLAKTKVGSLVQKSITVPTESITNFVNDKSGMGLLLCSSIVGLYNNAQDAPKDKKVATIADDYIGTMGSIAISTPLAFGATYGLASLKNLKGDTIISKGLKQIGKFFGMGLERYAKDASGNMVSIGRTQKNIFAKGGGLALRFGLVMFVFGNLFSKPIKGAIHKIFGEPYDKATEEQKKAAEEAKNTVIPELGITQGELMEKIEKNPQVLQRIQQEPMLARELQANPKKLLELLDGSAPQAQTPSNRPLSPANQNFVNGKKPTASNNQNNVNNTPDSSVQKAPKANTEEPQQVEEQAEEKQMDTATYIPSSEYIAKSSVSTEQSQEINNALTRADKILAKAEKYI